MLRTSAPLDAIWPSLSAHEVPMATPNPLSAAALAADAVLSDAIIEQMAQEVVYQDNVAADLAAFLTAQGYGIGPKLVGSKQLVMRVFTPHKQGLPAIVAFRGTVTSKVHTLLSDLEPSGIGKDQF